MNENYKNWSWVWNGKPVDGGGIEKYPDWAKDYHAVWDTETNKLKVNPSIYTKGAYPVNPQEGDLFLTDESLSVEAGEDWVEAQADETFSQILWDEGGSWDELSRLAEEAPSGRDILEAGIDIITLLLKKNISYGNSAIDPLRLFSNASVEEQIMVRLDDKLSRLKNNQTYPGDNDVDDLIGYLILLKVVRRKSEE